MVVEPDVQFEDERSRLLAAAVGEHLPEAFADLA
jgi:hypothetical protein